MIRQEYIKQSTDYGGERGFLNIFAGEKYRKVSLKHHLCIHQWGNDIDS